MALTISALYVISVAAELAGVHPQTHIIQVATRCATLDEFVEKFATFAWEGSLVLPAATALPVGTQGRFVVLLKDQTVAMRGSAAASRRRSRRRSARATPP